MNYEILMQVKTNLQNKTVPIKKIEQEWSKLKYVVLEKSPQLYNEIRQLLTVKVGYSRDEFLRLIELALTLEENTGYAFNALQHVWGYFKKVATEEEKAEFEKKLRDYTSGSESLSNMKEFLYKLSVKYQRAYLLKSYYFQSK
ncbi:MAG: YbgA family protein [Erysipelothrix sp.]|nr:YbgA family protein [Erysipelothrix sp.]